MRISDWSSDVCSSDLQIAAVEQFLDLLLHLCLDPDAVLETEVPRLFLEQVGVEVELLQVHLGVEDVFLVNIDIKHLLARADRLRQNFLDRIDQIGRASCRERVCQYVYISVVSVSLQTKYIQQTSKTT